MTDPKEYTWFDMMPSWNKVWYDGIACAKHSKDHRAAFRHIDNTVEKCHDCGLEETFPIDVMPPTIHVYIATIKPPIVNLCQHCITERFGAEIMVDAYTGDEVELEILPTNYKEIYHIKRTLLKYYVWFRIPWFVFVNAIMWKLVLPIRVAWKIVRK